MCVQVQPWALPTLHAALSNYAELANHGVKQSQARIGLVCLSGTGDLGRHSPSVGEKQLRIGVVRCLGSIFAGPDFLPVVFEALGFLF